MQFWLINQYMGVHTVNYGVQTVKLCIPIC